MGKGKIKSITKKLLNLDIGGYLEGKDNYENRQSAIEEIAIERAEVCAECDMNIVEPIDELKIHDDNIPSISERCCDACGCSLPYLLRQNKKSCKLNKWK